MKLSVVGNFKFLSNILIQLSDLFIYQGALWTYKDLSTDDPVLLSNQESETHQKSAACEINGACQRRTDLKVIKHKRLGHISKFQEDCYSSCCQQQDSDESPHQQTEIWTSKLTDGLSLKLDSCVKSTHYEEFWQVTGFLSLKTSWETTCVWRFTF